MTKVLIPLPMYGFDPTEVAIPWKLLKAKGKNVLFTTPHGEKPAADEIMLTGKNLGIAKNFLKARKDAVAAYRELEQSEEFNHPLSYDDVLENTFDAMLLPGGHDKEVRGYLESEFLQHLITDFFTLRKPVAAICHGVLLVARSIDPITQRSVLLFYKTTSLLRTQEVGAYNLTRFWMDDYYLTYPEFTVEDEVRALLARQTDFIKGPLPILRDSPSHMKRGFTVRDRNFLSARWPGDIYNFSTEFLKMLEQ